jgi:hypothetical protein
MHIVINRQVYYHMGVSIHDTREQRVEETLDAPKFWIENWTTWKHRWCLHHFFLTVGTLEGIEKSWIWTICYTDGDGELVWQQF